MSHCSLQSNASAKPQRWSGLEVYNKAIFKSVQKELFDAWDAFDAGAISTRKFLW